MIHDGEDPETRAVLVEFSGIIDDLIIHKNRGLGPCLNQGLQYINALNYWFGDPKASALSQVSDFVCYTQDDVLYSPGWLDRLTKMFLVFVLQYRLGFATGIESIEHPVYKNIGNGMVLKKWIRATQMLAPREYWMSMLPIPRFDPETQYIRAKPNDGIGSGVDWHFIRNHPLSIERSGKNCLVIPGLCQHAGYKDSTWLKRELPESEDDKKVISHG